MKKNMGAFDRLIRTFIAAAILGLIIAGVITGIVGAILLVLAFILALTSFISFCPVYKIFNIRSNRKEDHVRNINIGQR